MWSASAKNCELGQELQATNNFHRSPIKSPSLPTKVAFQAHSASQMEVYIYNREYKNVQDLHKDSLKCVFFVVISLFTVKHE